MIKEDDIKGLNFDNIKKRCNELEKYNGKLPILIYNHIDFSNHENYIDKEILEAYNKERTMYVKLTDEEAYNYENKELIKWINDNPQFKDLIIL